MCKQSNADIFFIIINPYRFFFFFYAVYTYCTYPTRKMQIYLLVFFFYRGRQTVWCFFFRFLVKVLMRRLCRLFLYYLFIITDHLYRFILNYSVGLLYYEDTRWVAQCFYHVVCYYTNIIKRLKISLFECSWWSPERPNRF